MTKLWKTRLNEAIKRGYALDQDVIDASGWKSCKIGEVVNKSKLIKEDSDDWSDIKHNESRTEGLSTKLKNFYAKLDNLGYEFSCLLADSSKSGCSDSDCSLCSKPKSEKIKFLKKALKVNDQIDKLWVEFIPLRKKAIKEGILDIQ